MLCIVKINMTIHYSIYTYIIACYSNSTIIL